MSDNPRQPSYTRLDPRQRRVSRKRKKVIFEIRWVSGRDSACLEQRFSSSTFANVVGAGNVRRTVVGCQTVVEMEITIYHPHDYHFSVDAISINSYVGFPPDLANRPAQQPFELPLGHSPRYPPSKILCLPPSYCRLDCRSPL
jgi:hypothetical protein